jgi:hypothetical protein
MTGFGRRTPRELPIRISCAFIDRIVPTLYPLGFSAPNRRFCRCRSGSSGVSFHQDKENTAPDDTGDSEPAPYTRAFKDEAYARLG